MNDTFKSNVVSMFCYNGYGEAVRFAMSSLNCPMEEAIDIVDECIEGQF